MRQVVRAGDTAFDIGANLGLHSVLLARLVGVEGRLHAFEPNVELHYALARTFRDLHNAVIHPCALSNETADARALFHPGDHLKVSLADWTAPWMTNARTLTCPVDTIDNLLSRAVIAPPDFIKCDVEGAELRVFQGATTVLNQLGAPIVLFEANAATAAGFGLGLSAVTDFLEALPVPQYRFFDVAENLPLPPLTKVTAAHSNVLAVPAMRLSRLSDSGGIV
jgi:FkbM family methyltransferase